MIESWGRVAEGIDEVAADGLRELSRRLISSSNCISSTSSVTFLLFDDLGFGGRLWSGWTSPSLSSAVKLITGFLIALLR